MKCLKNKIVLVSLFLFISLILLLNTKGNAQSYQIQQNKNSDLYQKMIKNQKKLRIYQARSYIRSSRLQYKEEKKLKK